MSANRPDKNGRDHEEVADSECSSDSRSRCRDGHEDEKDFLHEERSDARSENEDHSEGIDVPVDSDEVECVKVRGKVVQVDPKELEDFDRMLEALVQESLESRKLELRARPIVNMKLPMNAFEGSKDSTATEAADGDNLYDEIGKSGGVSKVCVKVLVKKGHKLQTKQMFIPGDCSLVQSTKQQGAAEFEEKQNIKRKVLEYNEREEEELSGGSSRTGNWGQAGSSTCDGPNRGGGVRQHYYVAGGFYRGYEGRWANGTGLHPFCHPRMWKLEVSP